jgi:4-amino-4-deoxy-L-arabinose transferase-like glycosyltransferase
MKPLERLLLVFVALELGVVLFLGNGVFTDEGIYVLAGRSLLLGIPDRADYALWLDGSPFLFPVVSGLAFLIGGIAASRLVAAALAALGLWFFARFVRRSFGRAAALWATLGLAANGAFFALGHLAVYDALSFAALTACLWCTRELARAPEPKWMLRAALAAALAVTSKYTVVILLLPCVPLALLSTRRRSSRAVAFTIAGAAALAVSYMYVAHGEIVPSLTIQILTTHGEHADRGRVALEILCLMLLPLALALAGFRHVAPSRRDVALVMLVAGVVWPLLHLVMSESVSLSKHIALSGVYLYPLAGVGLARLWRRRRSVARVVCAVAVTVGSLQAFIHDRSWPDLRPLAADLLPRLGALDTVGIASGWDFAFYAVTSERLPGPLSVMSSWRMRQGENPCHNNWIIGTQAVDPSARSPAPHVGSAEAFARAAEHCGFERVASFPVTTYSQVPPFRPASARELVVYEQPRPALARR